MKKAICMLLSLCVLLPLIGCHVQPTEDPTVPSTEAVPGNSTAAEATLPEEDPWYSKIRWFGRNDNPRDHSNEWSQPVLEMPEAFYYIGDDGLYRYDKQSGQDDLLIRGDIQGLFRYEGKVYYSTPQQICCLTDDSGGSSVVWDSCLYPDSDEYLQFCLIVDFQLYDGSLYIKIDGIHAIRYVLETGQTEHFLDDCQADANESKFAYRFFVVTESAVFWRESESGIVHCVMK